LNDFSDDEGMLDLFARNDVNEETPPPTEHSGERRQLARQHQSPCHSPSVRSSSNSLLDNQNLEDGFTQGQLGDRKLTLECYEFLLIWLIWLSYHGRC
jgi:hypothetical protein